MQWEEGAGDRRSWAETTSTLPVHTPQARGSQHTFPSLEFEGPVFSSRGLHPFSLGIAQPHLRVVGYVPGSSGLIGTRRWMLCCSALRGPLPDYSVSLSPYPVECVLL